jgi:FkbM family methyltransferase
VIVDASGLRVALRDGEEAGSLGDRAAFAQVFLAGEYDFLLDRMSLGDIVLDAGANIGCFALRASRRVGVSGVVIAVEPEPTNVACLEANIRLNGISNVIVVGKALDAISDRMVNIVGTGTTACVEEPGTVSQPWGRDAGTARRGVRTTTLDEVVEHLGFGRLDVIKMDIEGSENSIFANESSSNVLATAKAVAVEVHDHEGPRLVQNRLRAEGFAYVGEVEPESAFLISAIRHGLRRPGLVLKLYGLEVVAVVARMLWGTGIRQSEPAAAHLLAMVYASR